MRKATVERAEAGQRVRLRLPEERLPEERLPSDSRLEEPLEAALREDGVVPAGDGVLLKERPDEDDMPSVRDRSEDVVPSRPEEIRPLREALLPGVSRTSGVAEFPRSGREIEEDRVVDRRSRVGAVVVALSRDRVSREGVEEGAGTVVVVLRSRVDVLGVVAPRDPVVGAGVTALRERVVEPLRSAERVTPVLRTRVPSGVTLRVRVSV